MKRLPLRSLEMLASILLALAPIAALAAAAALFIPLPALADAPGKLTLTVTGIKEAKGALMIAVFDQAGYEAEKPLAQAMVPVAGASATTTIDLPAGTYGIKMFHDVDGDGKLGMNPFGIPIEPYAFSNNAKGQFGPAIWKAAAFDVGADGASHSITLN